MERHFGTRIYNIYDIHFGTRYTFVYESDSRNSRDETILLQ